MKTAIELITDERKRQIEVKGYTQDLDDRINSHGSLAGGASVYAMPMVYRGGIIRLWPWSPEVYKPSEDYEGRGRIKELVKAGELIVAEIERLQRKEEIK